MRRLVVMATAGMLLATVSHVSAVASPAAQAPHELTHDEEEGGVTQPSDALADDLDLTAEANGLTVGQAAVAHGAAAAVGAVAEQVAEKRPDKFVGSAVGKEPGDPPILYIKGPVDDFIRGLLFESEVEILVEANQPFSFDELEERKLRVHYALQSMGFRNIATSVNIAGGGVIPAGVTMEVGLPNTVEEIKSALPLDLRSSVRLTLQPLPVVNDFASFGGMRLRSTGGPATCTSGWSVRSIATGTLGIATAGHCGGMNRIAHPGDGEHILTGQGEHRGQWGDVEWHASDSTEPDDFYRDPTVIYDVSAIEPRTGIPLNETVCVYGRTTNERNCSLASGFRERLMLVADTRPG